MDFSSLANASPTAFSGHWPSPSPASASTAASRTSATRSRRSSLSITRYASLIPDSACDRIASRRDSSAGGALQSRLRLARGGGELDNRADHGLHLLVAEHDRIEHDRFRKHVRLRFHHQHRVLRSGDDEVKIRFRRLPERRIENELIADAPDTHRPDRPVEWQPRYRERGRCTNQRWNVRIDLGIEREHGDDDLHLVSIPVGEQGAQGAIDEAGGERFLLRGPSLALEEAAGNLARRIGLLGRSPPSTGRNLGPSPRWLRPRWPAPWCRQGLRAPPPMPAGRFLPSRG